jgi:hypothetical protein
MSSVQLDDEDVDALLDMCWSDQQIDACEENPKHMSHESSPSPDESFVHVREIGCESTQGVNMPTLPHGLTTQETLMVTEPVVVDDSLPGAPSTSFRQREFTMQNSASLSLLDLPLENEGPPGTQTAYQKQCQTSRVPIHPAPQLAEQVVLATDTRPIIPRGDFTSVTTLATVSHSPDELETLEESIAEETQRIREIERVLEARKIRRDQLRRDYAMALVRSMNIQPLDPVPSAFTIVVTRSQSNANIGLVVCFDETRGYLEITHVKTYGLIPEANEERRQKRLPIVEQGDFLVSINGVSGDKYLMTQQLVESPTTLQLMFVKDNRISS